MENFDKTYLPLSVTYNKRQIFLYTVLHENHYYIFATSLKINRKDYSDWHRYPRVLRLEDALDKKLHPLKSRYTEKNKYTWLELELFKDYANWLGKQYKSSTGKTDFVGLGDFVQKNISKLYREYDQDSDPYFMRFRHNEKLHVACSSR